MQQLKLFPQPTPVPQYKAGDWVKTKRKPTIAAWIKRGEIFKINAVHPTDGSIQFWNPHINQWDFLYPDEVKSCSTPSTVETVVENLELPSTVETVVENLEPPLTAKTVVENLEFLSTAETVVENLKPLSTAESVVENLEPPPTAESVVENLELNRKDSGYNSNGWIDFHYKVRINGKQHSIRHQQDKCTGPYYTYRWLEGKTQRAKYIESKKFGEVYRAIALNQPTSEILKIISNPNKLDTILKK